MYVFVNIKFVVELSLELNTCNGAKPVGHWLLFIFRQNIAKNKQQINM